MAGPGLVSDNVESSGLTTPVAGKLPRQGLVLVLLCAALSVVWGTSIARGGIAWIDFRAVYAGTRCLMHHENPYRPGELEREYLTEDGQRPRATPLNRQCITLFVNLPTTFVLVAPFALVGWGTAHVLWMLLTGCAFLFASLLMWSIGARYAPRVATLLACLLAINSVPIFVGGNTAGIVVGFCGIAVWCFLENRFVRVGVLCLALSLAVKPHDAGLVWFYFVLAGGVYRKRAFESLAITAVLGLAALAWVSHIAPHWMDDWHANLVTISSHGGINDPSPNAVKDGAIYSIVDLQSALSIFCDEPRFYNTATYLFCGALLLAWAIRTLRIRFSVAGGWIALAAVVPFSLLITYHRVWDAQLLMLAIPACCRLWAEGGRFAKPALLFTCAAILFSGEITLGLFWMALGSHGLSVPGIAGQSLRILLTRPAPIALLALGLFYSWVYIRSAAHARATSVAAAEVHA